MADKPQPRPRRDLRPDLRRRAGADPGYVEELAAYVDAQMREVSRSAGAVDSVRVAVLAALNIADECFRLARQVRRGGDDERRSAPTAWRASSRRPRRLTRDPR